MSLSHAIRANLSDLLLLPWHCSSVDKPRSLLDSLLPTPLPQPKPLLWPRRIRTHLATRPRLLLKSPPVDMLQRRQAILRLPQLGRLLAEGLFEIALADKVAFLSLLLSARRVELGHSVAGHEADDEVRVFGQEDGNHEGEAVEVLGRAVGAETIVAEHVGNRCCRDAAHPGNKFKIIEPGANAVATEGCWTLRFKTDLDGVGA